jgi:mRNA-degrading endonuclease RelE of RelBE toxin-antitoxin system
MLELTPGERVHPTSQKIFTYLEERLEAVRRELEKSKTEQETNILRGRVAEVRMFMGAWDDEPIVE